MKRYALSLMAILSLSVRIYAQVTAQESLYGLDEGREDHFAQFQRTPDGGFIVTGYTWSWGAGGSDAFLLKTDLYGKRQWYKTYGGDRNERGLSVALSAAGGYVVAGSIESGVSDGRQTGWLFKVNPAGEIEWEQTTPGMHQDEIVRVLTLPDESCIAVGNTVSGLPNGQDVFIRKYNEFGQLLDYQILATSGFDRAIDAVVNPTGVIAVNYLKDGQQSRLALFSPVLDQIADVFLSLAGLEIEQITALSAIDDAFWAGGRSNNFRAALARIKGDGSIDQLFEKTTPQGQNNDVLTIIPDVLGLHVWLNSGGSQGYIWNLNGILDIGTNIVVLPDNMYPSMLSRNASGEYAVFGDVTLTGGQSDIQFVDLIESGGGFWTQNIQLYGKTGQNTDEFCFAACASPDGGVVSAAIHYQDITGYDTRVFKIDGQGEIVWEKNISVDPSEEYENCWSVEPVSDGGYVLAITTSYTLTIVRLDAEGNELWRRQHEFSAISPTRFMLKPLPQGGFIAVGRLALVGGNVRATLMRFSMIGDLIWTKQFGAGSDQMYDVETDGANGFVLCGRKRLLPPLSGYQAWMIKTNAAGSLLWEYADGGASTLTRFFDLAPDGAGNWVALGYRHRGINNQFSDFLMTSINGQTGAEMWSKNISHTVPEANHWGYNLVKDADGGYYMGGFAQEGGANMPNNYYPRRISVVKTDANGQILWRDVFGEDYSFPICYAGMLTSDGRYVMAGTAVNRQSNDVYILNLSEGVNQPVAAMKRAAQVNRLLVQKHE